MMQNPYNPYEFPPCFADLSFPPEPNDAEEDISEAESSDSTWSSSSSDDDSILSDDSILTFDSAESMTYVLPSSEHKNACYVFRSDTKRCSRPESELSWRMDPADLKFIIYFKRAPPSFQCYKISLRRDAPQQHMRRLLRTVWLSKKLRGNEFGESAVRYFFALFPWLYR